jgi:hypothetical protein
MSPRLHFHGYMQVLCVCACSCPYACWKWLPDYQPTLVHYVDTNVSAVDLQWVHRFYQHIITPISRDHHPSRGLHPLAYFVPTGWFQPHSWKSTLLSMKVIAFWDIVPCSLIYYNETTWRSIPEGYHLHTHCRENQKYHNPVSGFTPPAYFVPTGWSQTQQVKMNPLGDLALPEGLHPSQGLHPNWVMSPWESFLPGALSSKLNGVPLRHIILRPSWDCRQGHPEHYLSTYWHSEDVCHVTATTLTFPFWLSSGFNSCPPMVSVVA